MHCVEKEKSFEPPSALYYEARFDLTEVEGINCLVVLIKWQKGALDHEAILRERIVRELLGSLKLA